MQKLPPIPKPLLEKAIKLGLVIKCKHIHIGSCELLFLDEILKTAKSTMKMYIIIHILPILIFKLHKLRDKL